MAGNLKRLNRRTFVQKTSAAVGLGALSFTPRATARSATVQTVRRSERLPREIWIGSVSQNNIEAENHDEMIAKMLARMEEILPYEPDIICLPEHFAFSHLKKPRPPLNEIAEVPPGPITARVAEFARNNNCFVVAPTYTKANDTFYNAAVIIDRKGEVVGEYRKIRPTVGEMKGGLTPGPEQPPVFDTGVGKFGVQICYDIHWPEGWKRLRQGGAEFVFWPSAYAAGSMINTMAWQNNYAVISSAVYNTCRICDIDGLELAISGNRENWVCAPVNLEKALLYTWSGYFKKFQAIRAKYGRRIRIRNYFFEEEMTVIESRAPEIKIEDVLAEFDLKTKEQDILEAETMQRQLRQRPAQ